jgi:hypothetical protein
VSQHECWHMLVGRKEIRQDVHTTLLWRFGGAREVLGAQFVQALDLGSHLCGKAIYALESEKEKEGGIRDGGQAKQKKI